MIEIRLDLPELGPGKAIAIWKWLREMQMMYVLETRKYEKKPENAPGGGNIEILSFEDDDAILFALKWLSQ